MGQTLFLLCMYIHAHTQYIVLTLVLGQGVLMTEMNKKH